MLLREQPLISHMLGTVGQGDTRESFRQCLLCSRCIPQMSKASVEFMRILKMIISLRALTSD